MKIKITDLRKLILKTTSTLYTRSQAELMTDVLMFGELSGRPSHGLIRLLKGNFGIFTPKKPGKIKIHKKTKVSYSIDGNGNPGLLVAPIAMQEAIKLGKKFGIGVVGTKGSINSTGSLSYYCEKIAKENLICLIFTHTSPFIAPFNSVERLFGTNPIAFGIPSSKNPLIFDMSTGATTFGAIASAKISGKNLPENTAIDIDGNPTIDPHKAEIGAIVPFDNSYKGSGLGMMVEILGGLLPGASFLGKNEKNGWGNLFLVFSPDLLTDKNQFKKDMKRFIETLKASKTKDKVKVRVPGENTLRIRDENLRKGSIEVNDETIKKINAYLDS